MREMATRDIRQVPGQQGAKSSEPHGDPQHPLRLDAVLGGALPCQDDERLRFQATLLECQTDAALDGILVVGEDRRIISFNKRFASVWGIPNEVLESADDAKVLGMVEDKVVDPVGFLDRIKYLYKHSTEISRDEIALLDGRVLDRYSAPIAEPDGTTHGRVWYFRDITPAKAMEDALRRSGEELERRVADRTAELARVNRRLKADIQQRKQAEARLMASEAELNAVFGAMTDIVLVLDREGRCVKWAAGDLAPLHIVASEVVGKTVHDLLPADAAAVGVACIEEAIRTSRPVTSEYCCPTEDGFTWFAGTFSRLDKDRVVLVARDVTFQKRAEEEQRANEMRLEQASRVVHLGRFEVDLRTRRTLWSDEVFRLYGLELNTPVTYRTFLDGIHPDDRERMRGETSALMQRPGPFDYEARVLRPDGTVRHMVARGIVSADGNGEPQNLFGTTLDITERKESELALERYRLLAEHARDIILFVRPDGTIVDANAAASQAYGYTREQLTSSTLKDLHAPEARDAFEAHLEAGFQGGTVFETVHCRHDGSSFAVEVSAYSTEVNGETILLSVIRDVSERKVIEKELVEQAFHDSLTGLPNRSLFRDRLEHALDRSQRTNTKVGVIFVDLDGFKLVNDSLGHQAGDELLVAVASRLESCKRAGDTAARLGGDEFTVLLEDVPSGNEATVLAERVIRKLKTPFHIAGQDIFVSGSIGIAMSDGKAYDAEEMLRQADVAMYQAKASHKGRYVVFQHDMGMVAHERLRLETDLRRAIERDEFRLHFQPIVSMDTGLLKGVEALVRWQHPTLGLLPPDQFIPLQEQLGLIEPLTFWVLEKARDQALEWRKGGLDVSVSVNLSPFNLQNPDFAERAAGLVCGTSLGASWLVLEITENAVMMDPVKALEMLERLAALGITLSVDDFGTGYSSLAYLRQLPVQEVKIDKSFVMGIGSLHDGDVAIVRAIVNLSHQLNKTVVAEGVETELVWDVLKRLHCDLAQGYYVGRPMPADDINYWLRASRWDADMATNQSGVAVAR